MLTVKAYILTCCTLMCCLELLVLAAKWEDIERTKNMSVFIKESEQLLSNLRNNLKKSRETLDRFALDSEEEELMSDNEAKHVEALEAQLNTDFLRHNDKLIRAWNSEEASSAVSSKTNKGTLQDILTLLLPSNLKGSEVSSDLVYDAQSNLFGFGNVFGPASSTFPTPSPTANLHMPQDFLLRTIMRAPPPLPKYQDISRVRVNGSVVCFSVLQVCPTIAMSRTRAPITTSTGPEMINEFKYASIKSVTEGTQMPSSASAIQPGTLIPIDVYLKNRDVELDESSSDYIVDFTESISTLQTNSDNLFQNTDSTESLEVSTETTDSKQDDLINTIIINNDETGHDNKMYKLIFGGKGNSTESTSTPLLPSSTKIKQNYMLSTLFQILALTTGSTIHSTNNVTIYPTKSVSDETEAFKMHSHSSAELVTTVSAVKSNLGNGTSPTHPSSTASSNTSTSESTETTCAVISTWPGFADRSIEMTESSSMATSVSSTSNETSSSTGATSVSLPTSTTTATTPATTPASTRKMNFFLKMLYYLPNTRHKLPSTTPIPGNNGDSEPFQLVILDPQIFQFSKGNATSTTSTSKP